MKINKIVFACCFFAGILVSSCTSVTKPSLKNENSVVSLDESYENIIKHWSKETNIFFNFLKIADARAVLLNKAVVSAYEKERNKILGQDSIDPNIKNFEEGYFSIYVSFYTPTKPYRDLQKKGIWNIELKVNETSLKPEKMQFYKNKALLQPFFPSLSFWSSEYILVFKIPQELQNVLYEGKADLVELRLRSGLAQIELSWKKQE
ncbi:MAG: hypothetical protein K2X39_08925 [Silvanigrellaceae bacterium]|nr:hypothetical protein [Silvanigrellaceae bacterium]